MFMSSPKREIRHFHDVVGQKCTKKGDAHAKVFVSLNKFKPIAFLQFSLPLPSLLLKLPINLSGAALISLTCSRFMVASSSL